ncbi:MULTISPECIES: ATP-dependent helicase [Ectopseudomonas]|uniref:DNA 3'-5' helicase n=2 Tax=Ectopseudomonas TaxID=3236654 RepID=A0A1G6PR94_9GAMM|nr:MULTISPECIES: ATP-dependent helicase [Pseudomonas]MBP3061864.1 UvrD-helicase domain-containing protein [Pseudomonas chengduensis]NNB75155.1 ATP-dependent helicase [Pseudomonas chengduensis]SDC82016.1 ATP-dependent DNA helicase Rep [Pseudomonas chengduensis]
MELNPQQQAAIDHPHERSCLVMAGAGSGKTTVIALRAAKLAPKLQGQSVLMLTFSNKAAQEMKARIKRLGSESMNIQVDTYHSYGLRLLKDDYAGYGLSEGFTLLNEADVKRSIRQKARDAGLPKDISSEDRKRLSPSAWLNTWSLAKQAGFNVNNPENRSELCSRIAKAHNLSSDEIAIAWGTLRGYEDEKAAASALDFDDLLYLPLLRVARDESYRTTIRSGIGHIVVDEAQDTNRIQYELIKRLALGHCGVTYVGDDDQSIYAWRGADVSNLHRFVHNFSADQIRLEQNYRSTQAIVNGAADLISHNTNRLDKRPFSKSMVGKTPTMEWAQDGRAMADAIAHQIRAGIDAGKAPESFAVLYRTNRMAMLVEQGLRRYGVPYQVVGGMSLFERTEVVAVTAAIRLASNPRDTFALKAITPFVDAFGNSSSYEVCQWIEDSPSSSLAALPESIEGIQARALLSLKDFYEDLKVEAAFASSAHEFVQWAINGPMAILEREKDDQLREKRAGHLKALGDDIDAELAERIKSEPKLTWRDVLGEVALRDRRQEQVEGGLVTLSTIHRAKGLEWDVVHIAGFSNGLLPLDSREELMDEDAGYHHLEEERRLAYVGLTRARHEVILHHADSYQFPGMAKPLECEPSLFAQEVGGLVTRTFSETTLPDGCFEAESLESLHEDFQRLLHAQNHRSMRLS